MSIALLAGPIDRVTVVVPDLDAAIRTYRSAFGLSVSRETSLTSAQAEELRRPELTANSCVELSAPGDDRPGSLEVIEYQYAQLPAPSQTLGWAAAEFIVVDADAACRRAEDAGLVVLHTPTPVGAGGGLTAAQVGGPAGETIYLTEVRESPAGFDLPPAIAAIGKIFAVVLASAGLEQSRASLLDHIQTHIITDHSLPVRVLNNSFNLPTDHLHRISSLALHDQAIIEVDQYPPFATKRNDNEYGIICVSLRASNTIPTVEVLSAGGALLRFVTSV